MRKKQRLEIVNSLEVSSPCHNENFSTNSTETESGWYCGECKKEVHDLSRCSQDEILQLIEQTQGNFCALITRKADGSIITNEPPAYSRSMLATGLLLASTALLQEEAFAQVGGVNDTHQEVSSEDLRRELGEVAAPVAQTPNAPQIDENDTTRIEESCADTLKAADLTPLPMVGLVEMPPNSTETRGQVRVVPKAKK